MGQYYRPIILAPLEEGATKEKIVAWFYSFDYDNGAKLMEHSWIGNFMVQTFEKELTRMGNHYKSRVVWAGDYADGEFGLTAKNKKGEDVAVNLFDLAEESDKINPKVAKTSSYPYIVNHSKKQFVDKRKVPKSKNGWKIHPLPLLTCEGNGMGSGDYHGEHPLIGSWARDVISVEKVNPKKILETTDYEEIIFDIVEN